MNDLSYIYMLETSHYIQTMGDTMEFYYEAGGKKNTDQSENPTFWEKIKKMLQKIKEFFQRVFNTQRNSELSQIKTAAAQNPKLRSKMVKMADIDKMKRLKDKANKDGKRITAKQLLIGAGVTTVTVGSAIAIITKLQKETPKKLDNATKTADEKIKSSKIKNPFSALKNRMKKKEEEPENNDSKKYTINYHMSAKSYKIKKEDLNKIKGNDNLSKTRVAEQRAARRAQDAEPIYTAGAGMKNTNKKDKNNLDTIYTAGAGLKDTDTADVKQSELVSADATVTQNNLELLNAEIKSISSTMQSLAAEIKIANSVGNKKMANSLQQQFNKAALEKQKAEERYSKTRNGI